MGKRLTEFLVHKPQDKTHRILTSSVETISTLFMTYRGLKKNLLPLFYIKTKILTRENIRLSSLFAAVDVSFLRAKRPQRRTAKTNGCFRRLLKFMTVLR